MKFQIEVILSKVETKPTAKGSYQQCELTFKNLASGKVESKKVMSFTNKQVFAAVSGAQQGQQFTVTAEKGEKYWEWTNVEQAAPGQQAGVPTTATRSSATTSAPRSTYETPEERAIKQVSIARQSSLKEAVNTLSIGAKAPPKPEEVTKLAQYYTDWVMGNDKKVDLFDQPNDLPQEAEVE